VVSPGAIGRWRFSDRGDEATNFDVKGRGGGRQLLRGAT